MAKFKAGDRVRTLADRAAYRAHETGTVCGDDSTTPWVYFDAPNLVRDSHHNLGIPQGHAAAVSSDCLELIPLRTRAQIAAEIAKLQAEMAASPREPEQVWGVRGKIARECHTFVVSQHAAVSLMTDRDTIVEFVEVMK